MNTSHDLERRLADFYAAEAPRRAPDWLLATTLATIEGTDQRRRVIGLPWSAGAMRGPAKLAVAALVLLAVVAVGLVLVGNIAPRPSPVPLTWGPERYAQDWPAPPRSEPSSGAPDVVLVRGDETHWDPGERAWEGLEHVDPIGDAGSGVMPAIDILKVGGPGAGLGSYSIRLAGGVPLPVVDPSDRWMAYGIVIDTDGDGEPDERVGVDNMPNGQHRAWWTDLATGQTKWKAGPGYGSVYDNGDSGGSLGLDTWYPSAREESERVTLRYSGTPGRYYAWAAMIDDGRVVATDYAPDVGWLIEPEDPGLPLVGTTWSLEREVQHPSVSAVGMTLVFTPDGRLVLDLCRRGTATAQVTPDTIRLSDLTLTEPMCSPEIAELPEVIEMEADILAVFADGEVSYTLDAGVLDLRAGSNVLRLVGSLDLPPGVP